MKYIQKKEFILINLLLFYKGIITTNELQINS